MRTPHGALSHHLHAQQHKCNKTSIIHRFTDRCARAAACTQSNTKFVHHVNAPGTNLLSRFRFLDETWSVAQHKLLRAVVHWISTARLRPRWSLDVERPQQFQCWRLFVTELSSEKKKPKAKLLLICTRTLCDGMCVLLMRFSVEMSLV